MSLRNTILVGDVRQQLELLPDESVHCIVTSPPYWAMRDYGEDGQLGLEPTMAGYLESMTDVFREVRRVLRKDGTLWLNMGDGYVASAGEHSAGRGRTNGPKHAAKAAERMGHRSSPSRASNLKPKDLNGTSWRLAFALQDDGWWLRRAIIWHKPNPTPESARDRPTASHEYVFLMARSRHYFYDREAVREKARFPKDNTADDHARAFSARRAHAPKPRQLAAAAPVHAVSTRNMRDVWTITPQAYRFKHFAAFPEKLAERCIRAGTSEVGCCSSCGAPRLRTTAIDDPAGRLGKSYHDHIDDLGRGQRNVPAAADAPFHRTIGWRPSCEHEAPTAPCVVFDPFMGAGTTAVAALKIGRDYLGIEISADYVAIAERRISRQPRRMM